MDKHLVNKTFRDKETGQIVLAGSYFSTDDEKRLDDLFERGLLKSDKKNSTVKVEETKKPKSKKPVQKKSGD